jgi:predicted AAA+ superfamily ATPase
MVIFDISQLSESNPWWIDKKNINADLKIAALNKIEYKWDPAIRHHIHLDKDVILAIRGPRQVGKTTLLKLIIKDLLLNKNVKPENIFFFSFEINTAEELKQIIQTYLDWRTISPNERKYLFLDEICAVKEWSKTLIFFANKGAFANCSIVVTGSHSMDLKHSTELMPGRRGGDVSDPLDKILLPMKFSEYVSLVDPELKKILFDLNLIKKEEKQKKMMELFEGKIDSSLEMLSLHKKKLDSLFESYLLTGGIPATINEYKKTGSLSTNMFNVYISSIIGDLRRYGYKEHYLKQIIREIFNVLSNPISWNQFTKNTDIGSHNTVQEYMTALEELYVANISFKCTIHDKKTHPSMKKVYLLDPFFFHALHGWSNAKKDYFMNAKANLMNLEIKSKLVESVAYNHLCRFSYGLNPRDFFDPKDSICYYRDQKDKEIDFVLMFDEKMYPFEVKYQASISNSDFAAFSSFKKGVLITKDHLGVHGNYVQIPISLFLMLV